MISYWGVEHTEVSKRISMKTALSAAGEGAAEAAIGTGIAVTATAASKKKKQKNQAVQPVAPQQAPVAKGFWRGTNPESRRKRRRWAVGLGATSAGAGLLVHGPKGMVMGTVAGGGYALANREHTPKKPATVAKALGLGEVKTVKLPRKAANSKGSYNPAGPSAMGAQPKAKLTPMAPPGGTAGTGIGAYGIKRYGQA
jgi:hypothetical protein